VARSALEAPLYSSSSSSSRGSSSSSNVTICYTLRTNAPQKAICNGQVATGCSCTIEAAFAADSTRHKRFGCIQPATQYAGWVVNALPSSCHVLLLHTMPGWLGHCIQPHCRSIRHLCIAGQHLTASSLCSPLLRCLGLLAIIHHARASLHVLPAHNSRFQLPRLGVFQGEDEHTTSMNSTGACRST
jgi:hypothetical protein